MSSAAGPLGPTGVSDPIAREWRWLLVATGLTSLFCYFFGSVFDVVPWSVGRFLFYFFGLTLCLAAIAGYRFCCRRRERPILELGFVMTAVAGVAVNLMAVIQDTIFTFAGRRVASLELEAERQMVRQVLRGTNDVQLALDIVFDLWIAAGVAFLGWGMIRYLGPRWYGWLGVAVAAVALGTNIATLPVPPAESGLFDPGPAVAAWLGFFMLFIYRDPDRRREGKAAAI